MCSRENQVRFALFLESHSVPLLHLKIRGSFEDRLSDHFEWLRQLIATFVFRLSINVRFLALGCSIVISSTSGELTTHLELPRRSEKTASKMSRLFITSLSRVCGHVQNMENKFYPTRTHVIPYDK